VQPGFAALGNFGLIILFVSNHNRCSVSWRRILKFDLTVYLNIPHEILYMVDENVHHCHRNLFISPNRV
ncbi:MAG: hypothetical protein P8074_19795, partial [Anaerolineales bacterium]